MGEYAEVVMVKIKILFMRTSQRVKPPVEWVAY